MRSSSVLLTLLVFSLHRDFQSSRLVADALNATNNKDGDNERNGDHRKSALFFARQARPYRNKKKMRSNCCKNQEFKCTSRSEGHLRFISGQVRVCQSRSWVAINKKQVSPKTAKLPVSCLDAKFKGVDAGDGFYWINPSGVNDLSNGFLAYCDMTTAGGGWLLVAKITHDYAWICPEQKGSSCSRSRVDPLKANLFHPVHERALVDLSITQDENSGIHLKTSVIRNLFESGQQSVRFTFVTADTGWKASEDAYAAFNRQRKNRLFVDGQWVGYSTGNQDYTWNVIKHQRNKLKFTGSTLCWGNNVNSSYRFYDHGLHAGSASSGNKICHLANDEKEIMLKSHYALVDSTGRKARWDPAEFGFLNSYLLQVPCKRIALWVR